MVQTNKISLTLFSLTVLIFLIGSINGQGTDNKLYALQIVQVPEYYANTQNVVDRDSLFSSIKDDFQSAVRQRTFFFRNSNSQDESFSEVTDNQDNNNDNSMSQGGNQDNSVQSDPQSDQQSQQSQSVRLQDPGLRAPKNIQRQYLLQRLNDMRAQFGAEPLYIDDRLNYISQQHSRDMSRRGYFSHTNPDGQSPQDRAIRNGFNDSVGQNLAINYGLQRAHIALRNSEGHFRNSINTQWTRVGFGIYVQPNGRLYLTVMFSTRDCRQFPISQGQIASLQKDLRNVVIRNNRNIRSQNPAITIGIKNWINSSKSQSIFNYVYRAGVRGGMSMQQVTTSYRDGIVEQIRNANSFQNPNFSRLGLAIQNPSGCILKIYVVYAN